MRLLRAVAPLLIALAAGSALAAPAPVAMTLQDHKFFPSTLTVPAGERIAIELTNRDMATEEFDSHDLKVEKLVTPGGKVTFTVGPLAPGAYAFMGEFHPGTAQGHMIAGTR
ncbi:MAG: cupredoxin domain-containing protein [Pseudomonadota bacterium]|nr:cupredoxin domain-containing protein [Pseudomonadota bacterium]